MNKFQSKLIVQVHINRDFAIKKSVSDFQFLAKKGLTSPQTFTQIHDDLSNCLKSTRLQSHRLLCYEMVSSSLKELFHLTRSCSELDLTWPLHALKIDVFYSRSQIITVSLVLKAIICWPVEALSLAEKTLDKLTRLIGFNRIHLALKPRSEATFQKWATCQILKWNGCNLFIMGVEIKKVFGKIYGSRNVGLEIQ